MKYYTISFPGEHGQHVQETWSTDQILKSYYPYWCGKMIQNVAAPDLNPDTCISDWCVTHWATETDQWGNPLQHKALAEVGRWMDEDKNYQIATQEEHDEFVKKRNYPIK